MEAGFRMNAAKLIALLLEIERAVGKCDPLVIRRMVLEAEEGVMRLEQQLTAALHENLILRQRAEACERSSAQRLEIASWENAEIPR